MPVAGPDGSLGSDGWATPPKVPVNPVQLRGEITLNDCIAQDTFRLRVTAPQIAAKILPGQFIMIRLADRLEPLLGRPFALYDVVGQGDEIEILYLIFGSGTRALSLAPVGAKVDVWGPMGNTFPTQFKPDDHLMLVAGGIGQTPFLAVIKELLGQATYGTDQLESRPLTKPRKITLVYGARTKSCFAGVEDFERTGVWVLLASNDGSVGHQGYVTDLVKSELASDDPPTVLFGCGPEPMLEVLSSVAKENSVPCYVSLETKMACGYGVCFSCVCPVWETESETDYKRVCVEGPVFTASRLAWQH